MRTERIIKGDIIWSYINAQDLGQNVDPRIKLYNDIQNMTLKDIADFQKQWVKGRTYVYYILGDKKDLELDKLKAVGPIEELTQEVVDAFIRRVYAYKDKRIEIAWNFSMDCGVSQANGT